MDLLGFPLDCSTLDDRLPSWRFLSTANDKNFSELLTQFDVTAIIGYSELTENYAHYNGILERDIEQLRIFFSEKIFIDEWQAGLP